MQSLYFVGYEIIIPFKRKKEKKGSEVKSKGGCKKPMKAECEMVQRSRVPLPHYNPNSVHGSKSAAGKISVFVIRGSSPAA